VTPEQLSEGRCEMVSWADAVGSAVSPEARRKYDLAVSQVRELDPLVRDFIRLVKQSGKWPMAEKSEYDSARVPRALHATYSGERNVTVDASGDSWFIRDFVDGPSGYPDLVVAYRPGDVIEIGFQCRTMLDTISHRQFDLFCAAVARAADWAPRNLVNYLQRENIPIPGT